MDPVTGFVASFGVTLVTLVLAALMGMRARRKAHITLVVVTALLLVVTIYYAKELGGIYDLDSAGWITPVHLWMAKIATFALLLPIVTGIMTMKNAERFPWHKRMAWTVITLVILSAFTGTWMILAATPL